MSTEPEKNKHSVPTLKGGGNGGVYRKLKLLIMAVATTLAASTFVKIVVIPAASQVITFISLSSGIVTICESQAVKTSKVFLSICHLILPSPPAVSPTLDPPQQVQLEPQPVTPPKPTQAPVTQPPSPNLRGGKVNERNKRFLAIHVEAALWLARKRAEFHDFLPAMKAITDDDKANFSDDAQADWNTLSVAADLIKWPDAGLTSTNKTELPIKIFVDGSGSVSDVVASIVRENLISDHFRIVDSYADAALVIEIYNANERRADWDNASREWKSTTSFQVKAAWIGGREALFGDRPISVTKYRASDVKSIQASFDAAVTSATGLFSDWIRQH